MSGNCGECKFWGWHPSEKQTPDDGDQRCCRLFSHWHYFEPEPPSELRPAIAHVVPFAGADGGSFVTSASFGCNQFEGVLEQSA